MYVKPVHVYSGLCFSTSSSVYFSIPPILSLSDLLINPLLILFPTRLTAVFWNDKVCLPKRYRPDASSWVRNIFLSGFNFILFKHKVNKKYSRLRTLMIGVEGNHLTITTTLQLEIFYSKPIFEKDNTLGMLNQSEIL